MINTPYVYRGTRGGTGTTLQTELPAKLCGIDQVIWMTARRDTLSGGTVSSSAPCLECITTWEDQSKFMNDATLENSTEAANDPEYWPDYWTGDTTSNFLPFVSFDRKTFGPDSANFLNVPNDSSFSELTNLTFSTIFRSRQIEPNSTITPDDEQGSNVVLFQNGNDTGGGRTDGWGIDFGTGSNDLRIWYYDNTSDVPICDTFGSGNSLVINVSDWTEWMRLTVRISGNTIEGNLYNLGEFASNSGMTWENGCNNGDGTGIKYGNLWPANPNWFVAGQKGPDFPGVGGDQTILEGSWDIAEYILYNEYLPDSCVNTIWNYYDYRYGITNVQPVPIPTSPPVPSGSLILDLDATKDIYTDVGKTNIALDGELVHTWVDQSSNLYDVTQTTSGDRPIYKRFGDNNIPYIWFDDSFATNMIIPNDGTFNVSGLTIFIVSEITPVNQQDGDNFITNSAGAASLTQDGWRVWVEDWDSPGYATPDIRGQMEDSSSDASVTNGEVNENQIITYRFEENVTNRIKINKKTETVGTTTSSIDYSTLYDVVLGARWSIAGSTVALFLPHKLYRIVIFDEYLDDTAVDNFVTKLMTYHNIT